MLAAEAFAAYSFRMPLLDTDRQRAAWLILALGLALLYALWPFSTGLVGAPVLYVIMAPLHRWLTRWLPTCTIRLERFSISTSLRPSLTSCTIGFST